MAAASVHPPLPPQRIPRLSDPDDLLALTLHVDASTPDHLDWTGDLEDLVSMQVAAQLHSKRSHPALSPYTPPARAPPPTSTSASSSRFTAPGAAERSPSQPGRRRPSGIPRAGSAGSKSRSVSPEVPRGSPPLPAAAPTAAGEFGERSAGEGGWETLQVGSAAGTRTPPAQGTLNGSLAPRGRKPSQAATPPVSRAKTLEFPQASSSSGDKARAPRTPLLPAAAGPSPANTGTAGTPRKRAVTQSPSAATPSPSALAATRRRGAGAPANSPATPSASSTSGGKAAAPRRRKSISTSTPASSSRGGARRSPSSDRLRAAAAAGAEGDIPALPPWSDSPAPLVYRTSQGDLAFAYEGEEDAGKVRRPEDRVLPAVARRLEAERLARLAKEEGGEGTLVSEWSREGTPRRALDIAQGGARRAQERERPDVRAMEDVEMQDVSPAAPPPGEEPPASAPPRTSSRPLAPLTDASPAPPAPLPAAAPAPAPPTPAYPPVPPSPAPFQSVSSSPPGPLSPAPHTPGPAPHATTANGAPSPKAQDEDASGAGCCRCGAKPHIPSSSPSRPQHLPQMPLLRQLATLVSILSATLFLGFGLNALLRPAHALSFFALSLPSDPSASRAVHALVLAYGARDIFIGAAMHAAALLGGRRALGWTTLAAAGVAGADGVACVVAQTGAQWQHWGYAPGVALAGLALLA
ncbi:hypothetical protein JCM10450v2_007674 [Rhodotorula kratochvilovae]